MSTNDGEKWDDDFLGEGRQPLKLKLNRKEDQSSSDPDASKISREQKRPSFHKEEVRKTDSMDNIPNIGLDGIDILGEFGSEKVNYVTEPSIQPDRSLSNNRTNNKSKGVISLGRSRSNNSDVIMMMGGDDVRPTPRATVQERVSDNDSNQFPSETEEATVEDVNEEDDEDLRFFEEMEEEDDDYRVAQQYIRKEPTFRTKFQAPNILQLSSTIQEKGSLLEFLEMNLRDQFASNLHPSSQSIPKEKLDLHYQNISGSDSAVFIDEEEVDSRGIINQHLRGLTEWIHSTSSLLNSCITSQNSNPQSNARTLMESEVQVFQTDVYFIEQVLERCEQEPTKESCIYSLEVIVKWIRGICHQKISDDADSSEEEHLFQSNQKRSSNSRTTFSSATMSSNLSKFHITLERLEQLFARCDYILNEQSKFTVAQILELISFLREELNAISSGYTDRKRGLASNRGHVVRDIIHFLCNQISLSRIHVYMLDIKAHINFFDSLSSHLEALEVIWDELEAIKTWLSTVSIFLPTPKIDLRSVSTDTQLSRDPALTLQSHPKFEEAMRAAIQEEVKIALTANLTTSIHYHRFNQSHSTILSKMLIELQACCLANKLLLLSEISSITLQRNAVKPRHVQLSHNLPHSKNGAISSPPIYSPSSSTVPISVTSSLLSNHLLQQRKGTLELHSKYNVVYEINIGTQFVDLMVKLESPSIVRAKLAFAAVCYLQCLLRDALPWQSGRYHRIVLKKRNADGFNILKRGDSELGFGVDGDDIDYYIEDYSTAELERAIIGTFSAALGSIDEIKNLQSLLYEAAFDLFPHYRNYSSCSPTNSATHHTLNKSSSFSISKHRSPSQPNRPLKKSANGDSCTLSPLSDMLFAHLTTSLDMNLSIHDKIKEKNPSSPPRSPRKVVKSQRFAKSSSNDHSSAFDHRAIVLVNKRIKDFVPSRNKHRQLTHLMRYELFLFSFSLLSQFVAVIYDVTPNLSLELYEICARIAAHVDKRSEQLLLQKKAFLLAIKLGRSEAAIKHGRQIWQILLASIRAGATVSSNLPQDVLNGWGELLFVTKQLIEQYFINAQYPIAIKVITETLQVLLSIQKQLVSPFTAAAPSPIGVSQSLKRLPFHKRTDLDNGISALLLQLGKAYLFLGKFDSSLNVFQRSLLSKKQQEASVKLFETKIIFLSWMVICFYEMREYECAELIVQCMKSIRTEQLQSFLHAYVAVKPLPQSIATANQATANSAQQINTIIAIHNIRVSEQKHRKRQSRDGLPTFRSSGANSNPFLTLNEDVEQIESADVDENENRKKFSASAVPKSPSDKRNFVQRGLDTGDLHNQLSSDSLSSAESSVPQISEDSLYNMFNGHCLAIRFLTNASSAALPHNCINDQSVDLGLMQAKSLFRRKHYEKALHALTPVIISSEVIAGGRNGTIEGILELAELYFLRGQIQFEACRVFTSQANAASHDSLRFPFSVGSAQLLSSIQILSVYVLPYLGRGRQQRKSFQSLHSRLLEAIEITRNGPLPPRLAKSGVTINPTLSSFLPGGLNGINATAKAKVIPYNNASDLLWDSMKWFRRASDLFNAAGDQINAAKSANFIAECNLLPTFVPHLFFNVPLNTAIDLSLYQTPDGVSNVRNVSHQHPVTPSPSSESQFSLHPSHDKNAEVAVLHQQSNKSITGTTTSVTASSFSSQPANLHASVYNQTHSQTATNVRPPLPSGNKTLAMSGATVVKRFASLEEVEKVSLFALEKFLEAFVCPLELIKSYLNLAEMMLITNNIQDSLHFWWEAKELFLHLFVDGCFIPIVRVCSLDYFEKLLEILDRIVRCLWKWDKNIRNSHLHLLEIHNLARLEWRRRLKRHAIVFQVNRQHVQEFLQHILRSCPGVTMESFGRKGPDLPKASQFRKGDRFQSANMTQSSSLPQLVKPKKKKAFSRMRKGIFSLFRGNQNTASATPSATASRAELVSATQQLGDPFIETLVSDLSKEQENKTDCSYFLHQISTLINERIMNFGWSNFIDHNKQVVNAQHPLMSQSRDSTTSSMDPRSRSNDSAVPFLPIPRSSLAQPTLTNVPDKLKEIEEKKVHDAVMVVLRRSSFSCKRLPRFLRPFILTWGDVLVTESNVGFGMQAEEETCNEEDKSRLFGEDVDKGLLPSIDFTKKLSKELGVSEDPLVALLTHEKPVDAFCDFEWMDTSYSLDYVPSLLPLPPSAFSRSPILPELLEQYSSSPILNTNDPLTTLEAQSEKVLIYRIWMLLQRNHNLMMTHYRQHAISFSTIGKITRSALTKISHNMLRLKAFTRQMKGSLLSFDHLLLLLHKNPEFSDSGISSPSQRNDPNSHSVTYKDEEAHLSSLTSRFCRLQYRLPKLLYLTTINNLVLAYHPYSSREMIQIVNQDCASPFLSFNGNNSSYQGLSAISSASHSQSNYELVSNKFSTNTTHNASMAAIKTTATNVPIISANQSHAQLAQHPSVQLTHGDGIATAYDSFVTAVSDWKSSAIQFSESELSFIFDLHTQQYDYQSGGSQNRASLLQRLREQELSSLLNFIRLCSDYELQDPNHNSVNGTNRRRDVTELYQHYSPSTLINKETVNPIYKEDFATSTLESFSGELPRRSSLPLVPNLEGENVGYPNHSEAILENTIGMSLDPIPLEEGNVLRRRHEEELRGPDSRIGTLPVTLICGSFLQMIPWEGILSDLSIVRNIGLMPLVMQLMDGQSAFSVNSAPQTAQLTSLETSAGVSLTSFAPSPLLPMDERDIDRGSSYNSYGSSSSGSQQYSHGQSANRSRIRGTIGPDQAHRALYVTVSWDSSSLPTSFNRELQTLQNQRQLQAMQHQILPLLNSSSSEVIHSFHQHVQRRHTELLIRSNSTNAREEKSLPKHLEKFQNISALIRTGFYPMSVEMSEKNASSILENHESLLLQLDAVHNIQHYEEFWANIDDKLFELNSRNRFFTTRKKQPQYESINQSSLAQQPNSPNRKLTEEEENEFLSKIYLLETNHNFSKTFPSLVSEKQSHLQQQQPDSVQGEEVSYYPILFVPLSEMVDISEALVYLSCFSHRKIVTIFAPSFLMDTLLIEMKIAFDAMYRANLSLPKKSTTRSESRVENQMREEAMKSSPTTLTPISRTPLSLRKARDGDRKSYIQEKQQQLLSAYQQDRRYPSSYQPPPPPDPASTRKGNFRPSFKSIRKGEPSSSSTKQAFEISGDEGVNTIGPPSLPGATCSLPKLQRILTYQVIMEVVERIQKQHAASISVFI